MPKIIFADFLIYIYLFIIYCPYFLLMDDSQGIILNLKLTFFSRLFINDIRNYTSTQDIGHSFNNQKIKTPLHFSVNKEIIMVIILL